MNHYKIADISIHVIWENEEKRYRNYLYHDCIVLPRNLASFRCEEQSEEPDMTAWVHELCEFTGSESYKRVHNQAFFERAGKNVMLVFDPYNRNRPGYSLEMSKDYSRVDYIPHIREYEHYDLQWMMYPFEGRILYRGGFVLHGAAVEFNGKGIIFTGVSGAGKTTQAHLWQRFRNAIIINGDCPAIRMENGIPYLYGTPWCGTSGESINRRTHLSAVVAVKQGETNSIRELNGTPAYLALLANIFHSCFDKEAVELSIANLERIVKQIRVYELTCTISEAAVEILERKLISWDLTEYEASCDCNNRRI